MLTKFDVANRRGNLHTFQLDDISDGYSIQDIGGLGPVKATLVSSSFAGVDGEQYQSARRETRNITIKLGLEPDWITNTVDDLRNSLYEFFMPKSEVFLTFYKDNGLVVKITGRVETCEPDIFSAEPMMDVSLICYDPDFLAPVPVSLSGTSVSSTTDTIIPYAGSVDTGIIFTLNVNRTLTDFTIYHTPPDGELRQLDFSGSLVSGDVLTISTVTGNKGATLLHTGTSSSVLYAVSPQSNWIEFQKGDNDFRVYAPGAGVPYTIEYVTKYGGL